MFLYYLLLTYGEKPCVIVVTCVVNFVGNIMHVIPRNTPKILENVKSNSRTLSKAVRMAETPLGKNRKFPTKEKQQMYLIEWDMLF